MKLLDKLKINHKPRSGGLDLLKYIGPGLLVTVGFIDPGNWVPVPNSDMHCYGWLLSLPSC